MSCVQLLGSQQPFGRIQEENCGSVSLSLRYDNEQSLLTVRIVRAHELLPREGHSGMDPYCRLRLLPDRRHQLHSKVRSAFRQPRSKPLRYSRPTLSRRLMAFLVRC